VSLGSNDLTQYTLAVDRTNPLVAAHFTPHHPAVLSLIRSSSQAAKEAGKSMSACGEMAGSSRYAPVLLGLGIRTLSMAASRVPEVVERLRKVSLAECEDVAFAMIDAGDASASAALLDAFLEGRPQKLARR
jgi:phosphotransferase system enzyme I (PtsI)